MFSAMFIVVSQQCHCYYMLSIPYLLQIEVKKATPREQTPRTMRGGGGFGFRGL